MSLMERLMRGVRGASIIPTRRLALVFAATGPIWLLSSTRIGSAVAWLAVALVLAVVTIDVAALPSQRDLDVQREFPEAVGVGDRVEGSYRIASRWGRKLFATLFD